MIVCKRCGRCCHYLLHGKLVPCLYLIKHGNNITSCRVYANRLGKLISEQSDLGLPVWCLNRADVKINYEGCPYNENNNK